MLTSLNHFKLNKTNFTVTNFINVYKYISELHFHSWFLIKRVFKHCTIMISRALPEVRFPAFVIRRHRICTACITREQIHSVCPDNSATLLANRFFPFPFPQQRSGRLVLSADSCWALALCDATAAKSVTGPCVTTRKRRSFILIIIYGCDRSECGTMWERSTHTWPSLTLRASGQKVPTVTWCF